MYFIARFFAKGRVGEKGDREERGERGEGMS
jgi:hypothetical protein